MIGKWISEKVEFRLKKHLYWGEQKISLFWHWVGLLKENTIAVVPISLLLIIALAVFFGESIHSLGKISLGSFAAIIGLTIFAEGLRLSIMPLSEMIGVHLPSKQPLIVVLLTSGVLGILVTYAEPAIGAMEPLARLVQPERAPYLFFLLNYRKELVVFAIGLGVGVAAVIGTLRFLRDWSLKPIILICLIPNLALSSYMYWADSKLRPFIGFSWDCGAVTTGPVTVPILIALGIGVMKNQRERISSAQKLQDAVDSGTASALEGFGIVTLASLIPVFFVQVLSIIISVSTPIEKIVSLGHKEESSGWWTKSPIKELIFAIRSILPLVFALLLIVSFLIKKPLPGVSVYIPDRHDAKGKTPQVEPTKDSIQVDKEICAIDENQEGIKTVQNIGHVAEKGDEKAQTEGFYSAASSDIGSAFDLTLTERQAAELYQSYKAVSARRGAKISKSFFTWIKFHFAFILGVLYSLIGLLLFNLGMTYGFSVLASQAGNILPAAFLTVSEFPKSPYYSHALGVFIVSLTIASLGFLATGAEPALNVLGRTVQDLSQGQFTVRMLITSVSVGVGSGMAIGSAKILFGWNIVIILLTGYSLACLLTYFSAEEFTNIAWDSAGVTTGPVTVPFVLSLGIGLSLASDSSDGFGMLTAASAGPIITVLLTSLIRKLAAESRKRRADRAQVCEVQLQVSQLTTLPSNA